MTYIWHSESGKSMEDVTSDPSLRLFSREYYSKTSLEEMYCIILG